MVFASAKGDGPGLAVVAALEAAGATVLVLVAPGGAGVAGEDAEGLGPANLELVVAEALRTNAEVPGRAMPELGAPIDMVAINIRARAPTSACGFNGFFSRRSR